MLLKNNFANQPGDINSKQGWCGERIFWSIQIKCNQSDTITVVHSLIYFNQCIYILCFSLTMSLCMCGWILWLRNLVFSTSGLPVFIAGSSYSWTYSRLCYLCYRRGTWTTSTEDGIHRRCGIDTRMWKDRFPGIVLIRFVQHFQRKQFASFTIGCNVNNLTGFWCCRVKIHLIEVVYYIMKIF